MTSQPKKRKQRRISIADVVKEFKQLIDVNNHVGNIVKAEIVRKLFFSLEIDSPRKPGNSLKPIKKRKSFHYPKLYLTFYNSVTSLLS